MNLKKSIKLVFPWIITFAIFAIIFSKIEFSEAMKVLKQADIKLFSLSILVSLLMFLFFAPGRYREILKVVGCRLSFFETLILRIGSIPIKGILPFKGGELTRVAYLKKRHNLSYPRGLASILSGYALSVFTLSLFIFMGWFFYQPALTQRIYLVLLFLIFLVLVLFFKKILKNFLKDQEIFDKFDSKTLSILFFHSLGFEGCKLLNTFLLFNALNLKVPYGALFCFAPLTILASVLPITPWGLGTRETTILILFSDYATPERLLGASLLVSFVNRLFPILLGLFFMKPFLIGLLSRDKFRPKFFS